VSTEAAVAAHPPRARWLIRGVILAIWSALGVAVFLLWSLRDLPRPVDALAAIRRPSLVLQDRSGRAFAELGDLVGETVHLATLPPAMAQAAVAIEDRRFWTHAGIDPRGLLRAAWVDLTRGHAAQGGSTITQQVAKTLFLSRARTFRRKLQELILSFWLERHFSKTEILEIWLNRVYLGSGTYGIDAAARRYFGVPATRLALWQCAVLAGLPKAPSRYDPRHDPGAATRRAREVLAAMAASGAITQAQADAASAAIRFPGRGGEAQWFADWVSNAAEPLLAPGHDAALRTTLDARLQHLVATRLSALLAGQGVRLAAGEGAVVALDARTGAVRAMVGGRDWQRGPFNRAVQARRQPGSAFKPFVWLAALEHGVRAEDTVLDAPITLAGWSPADFEPGWRGAVSLTEALALSLNTASVRLELRAGGPRVVAETARRLGVSGRLPETPALALGTGEVSLLDLAAAYAPFFNGGRRVVPHGITRVDGSAVAEPSPAPVISPEHAAALAAMLRAVVTSGTGRAAGLAGRPIAGKTGTTQDSRDAWFIGAAGDLIIGVWLGNDDAQPMRGVTGGSLPALLFRQIAAGV
jgi:penicillin-binding protein 1A